jgi:formyltetrahydrofolate-dependent phosphoribosylglycinamide formyltransferase
MSKRRRVGVLISGRGSNLGALIEATKAPDFPAEIALVISNRAEAAGLQLAADHGIATQVIAARDFSGRVAHDEALSQALHAAGAEIVCLAGYMRILSENFVEAWSGRMINIHPSLLPLFPGLDTHRKAIAAGMRIHGCTVHFVTAEMDEGPIIAQAAVPVLHADTEETLAARVLKAEHRLYPLALRLVAEGKVRMTDAGKALREGDAPVEDEMLVSG